MMKMTRSSNRFKIQSLLPTRTTTLGGCDDSYEDNGGSIRTTPNSTSLRKKKRVKSEIDNPFEEEYLTLIDQGQMTLPRLEESANREKARFELEQQSANRAKARFDLDRNNNKFFTRLEVAKAMNDYEELEN